MVKLNLNNSSVTYAHALLKIDDYWNRGITGKGIKIGIMDDGMGTHDALPISGGYACGEHTTYMQENTHATHCAGIALARNLENGEPAGIAPDASLYSIRMYYKTMEDRMNSFIEAIDYAIAEGIDILSMSVHLSENAKNLMDGKGSSQGAVKHVRLRYKEAFYRAYLNGVIIAVAAGNHNDGRGKDNIEFEEFLPKMPNVIAVASLTPINSRYFTSGVGKWVNVAAYGYRIRSTYPGNAYHILTGTSMATPQIAGILALYKQLYSDLEPQEVIDKLFENCKPVGGLNSDQQGKGVPEPPKELYDINVLADAKGNFRMIKDLTWVATDVYRRGSTQPWDKLEAMSNE